MKLKNNLEEEDNIYEDDEDKIEIEEPDENTAINLPLTGSSIYPKVYIGDSSRPLSGQFNQSEYIDDNVSRTWTGLLNSFFG